MVMVQKFISYIYILFAYLFISSFSIADATDIPGDNTENTSKKRLGKKTLSKFFKFEKERNKNNLRHLPAPPKAAQVVLATPKEHLNFLKSALKNAEERVIIASSRISSKFIAENFIKWLNVTKDGIKIILYTSVKGENAYLKGKLKSKLVIDSKKSIEINTINDCSIRCLIVDNNLFANGSFNWLYENKGLFFTPVIQEEAASLIQMLLNMLEKAHKKEKDLSLVNAEKVILAELPEMIFPRDIDQLRTASKDDIISLFTPRTESDNQLEPIEESKSL